MNFNLTNKRALVSGSTKGIGFAIAAGLAREGARVILNGRSQGSVDDALPPLLASRAPLPMKGRDWPCVTSSSG